MAVAYVCVYASGYAMLCLSIDDILMLYKCYIDASSVCYIFKGELTFLWKRALISKFAKSVKTLNVCIRLAQPYICIKV